MIFPWAFFFHLLPRTSLSFISVIGFCFNALRSLKLCALSSTSLRFYLSNYYQMLNLNICCIMSVVSNVGRKRRRHFSISKGILDIPLRLMSFRLNTLTFAATGGRQWKRNEKFKSMLSFPLIFTQLELEPSINYGAKGRRATLKNSDQNRTRCFLKRLKGETFRTVEARRYLWTLPAP